MGPRGAQVSEPILRVSDLRKEFPVVGGMWRRQVGQVKAVDGLSFALPPRQTLALIGESGCGKSTAARTLLKLLEPTGGRIEFAGQDITWKTRRQLRPLRREMQMVFQDPYSSLNPRQPVGAILEGPLVVQGIQPKGGRRAAVQQALERVGLSPEHYNRYPNEFSGGQRQRIGIARAIILRPKLIVADEPVSALDVSIQAQILNLLADLQREFGLSYVVIAHDLAVVRQIADQVAVMYLGQLVELAPAPVLYAEPLHPYTAALLSAAPVPDPDAIRDRPRIVLQGELPSASNPPSGCGFRTRCWLAQDRCAAERPPLREVTPGRFVACHYPLAGG